MIFFSSLNDYGLDLNQIKNIRILTCFDFIFWLIDLYTSTIFILKKKLLGGLLTYYGTFVFGSMCHIWK